MKAVSQSKVLAFALGAVASFLLIGVVNTQSGRNVIDPGGTGTDNPDRAYSRGVRIGDTLYVAGNTSQPQNTGDIGADIEAEIHNLLDTFQSNVEAGGLTMDDLVWVQVFCTDLALYDTFNRIYMTYFEGPLPSRAFIGSSVLLGNSHFEIMGTAVQQ